MGVVLDTSVLVAADRGAVHIESLLQAIGDEPVGIAAITAAELLHGCYRAPDPGIRARRGAFVESLLTMLPVLPFGLPEARRHAELWAELVSAGVSMRRHDLIIGSTALALGHSVATLNDREFSRIPGLRLVSVQPFIS